MSVVPVGFASWGDEVVCSDPTSGFDRLTEEAAERGLTETLPEVADHSLFDVPGMGGNAVAHDFDADGDIDLLIGGLDGMPDIYENDGQGSFEVVEGALEADVSLTSFYNAASALDLDGDGLSEVLFATPGNVVLHRNQGGLSFGDAEVLWTDGDFSEARVYLSLAPGDLDADGDLDLVLPAFGWATEGFSTETQAPDRFLLQDEGRFETSVDLVPEGEEGSRTLLGLVTDRDGDGDADVWLPATLGPPSAFHRNDGVVDGVPTFTDDAAALSANLEMAAMGIDSIDFDGDGRLDYCISDVGTPVCLASDDAGYYDFATASGLSVDEPLDGVDTIGWSLDIADLDADGWPDLVQAGGPDLDTYEAGLGIPDMVWRGSAEGFDDRTAELGFGDTDNHVGLATADLDGDGFLDVVLAGPGTTPDLWMNHCSEAAWTRIDLVGPALNREGYGARVEVTAGGTTRLRELTASRGPGQGPSEVHLGLGDAETIDRLVVTWPDGLVFKIEDVPVKRVVTVWHPKSESTD